MDAFNPVTASPSSFSHSPIHTPLASVAGSPIGSAIAGTHPISGAHPISGPTAPLQVKRIFIGNITLNKGKADECIRGVFVTLKDQHGNPMDMPVGWPPIEADRRERCKVIFQDLITKVQELNPTANVESASVSRDGFKFTDPSKQTIGFTANSVGATDGTQAIWSNFIDTLLTGNTDGQLSANIEAGPLTSLHSSRASLDSPGSGNSPAPFALASAPPTRREASSRSRRAISLHPSPQPVTARPPHHMQPQSVSTGNTSPMSVDYLADLEVSAGLRAVSVSSAASNQTRLDYLSD